MLFFSVVWACTSSEKSITTVNATPESVITSHQDGAEILEEMPVLLMGAVSDSNNGSEELWTSWYAGTDILCEEVNPEADGTARCETSLGLDVESITLAVRDLDNARADAMINVFVLATETPTVEILNPLGEENYYTDQLISFEGIVQDTEDDPEDLMINWSSSIDGELTAVNVVPTIDGEILGYSSLSEGQHVIELIAEDSAGKIGTDSIIIDVNGVNGAPSCEITAPSTNSAGQQGDMVNFFASVSDPDVSASQLQVLWSSDKDGELGSSTPNGVGTVSFPYDGLSLNTHVISLTVRDDVGEECVADIIYTVGSPPSLTLTSPLNNLLVNEGETVSFVAEVSDSEDSPNDISLTWESSLDGIFSNTQPNSNGIAQFNSNSLSIGIHNITVTATDSSGLYVDEILSVTVNGLPSQPSLSIQPDPAYTDDDLVALATGSVDPEGAAIAYLYDWHLNGVSTGQTGGSLPASSTTKGQTWMVRVTPSDGITTGAFIEESIVIQNSLPEMQSVSISPLNPSSQDDLTCSYTAVDADGDSISASYQWIMGGNTLSSTTNLLEGPFQQGDSIICRVTPDDGSSLGTAMDATISITNTIPSLSNLVLSPLIVRTDDILTATVNAVDADGDPLTLMWDWYVDSGSGAQLVLSNSGAAQNDSLDGVFYFEKNDSVSLDLTVSDGYTSTSITSASITVANTAPSAFNVVITPTEPVAGLDDLTCISQGSDVDGDTVSFSYAWTVDGNVTSYTTDTISASDIADDEVWVCIVTPSDGVDSGAVNSATVTIGADVEGAQGGSFCATAGQNTDSLGNQNISCLSENGVAGEEASDSSSNIWQPGSIFIFSPE